MSIYSSVTCFEEHGTARESRTKEEWTAQVRLRCAWPDRHALVDDLIFTPREWPHGPAGAKPIATQAGIVTFDTRYSTNGQCIEYDYDALVDVQYSSRQTTDETLFTESLEPSAEFLTLDNKYYRWGDKKNSDRVLEAEAPGKLFRGLTLVTTQFQLTAMPTEVFSAVGTVNSEPYFSTLLRFLFFEETLLYTPPVLTRTITQQGTKGFTLTMRFMYKPQTWNKFFRPEKDPDPWQDMFHVDKIDDGPIKIYEKSDLTTLLHRDFGP